MKLTIGYFYSNLLNLYGDRGNVAILAYRAQHRGFEVEVVEISPTTKMTEAFTKNINLVFMGGGPDSSQKLMYEDLLKNKKAFLEAYINNGGVGLFICGAYQLLGSFYKSADGTFLEGLNIFDFYTEHFGIKKPRCVGNIVCNLCESILQDPLFENVNRIGDTLVGFENHGGRTFMKEALMPLGHVLKGFGNNGSDKTEGFFHEGCIGTYLHGPLLAKNPHVADFLIAKSLGVDFLDPLDDDLVTAAHTASMKLRQ